MAKILLIVAQEGFQSIEYGDTRRILERAGHTVVTASIRAGIAVSHLGEEIVADISLSSVEPTDYKGVFIIGGPGALKDLDNIETFQLMKKVAACDGVLYGAICIAPRILAKAGLLKEKHATGWNGDDELAGIFSSCDVIYDSNPVVIDGRIITADGTASAESFGLAIAQLMQHS